MLTLAPTQPPRPPTPAAASCLPAVGQRPFPSAGVPCSPRSTLASCAVRFPRLPRDLSSPVGRIKVMILQIIRVFSLLE